MTYNGRKARARAIAQEWQRGQAETAQSYAELLRDQEYFLTLGKRYGLIKEFKENGII